MNKGHILQVATIVLALAASGCSTSRVEMTYGDAVRANRDAQIYDTSAAENPSRDPVDGTDGQRMEAVMEAHRTNVGSAPSGSYSMGSQTGQ